MSSVALLSRRNTVCRILLAYDDGSVVDDVKGSGSLLAWDMRILLNDYIIISINIVPYHVVVDIQLIPSMELDYFVEIQIHAIVNF